MKLFVHPTELRREGNSNCFEQERAKAGDLFEMAVQGEECKSFVMGYDGQDPVNDAEDLPLPRSDMADSTCVMIVLPGNFGARNGFWALGNRFGLQSPEREECVISLADNRDLTAESQRTERRKPSRPLHV